MHVNLYHVKMTKEPDDNSRGKNDHKDYKTTAVLVNEGEVLLSLHASWYLCGNQKFIKPALPDAGRTQMQVILVDAKGSLP